MHVNSGSRDVSNVNSGSGFPGGVPGLLSGASPSAGLPAGGSGADDDDDVVSLVPGAKEPALVLPMACTSTCPGNIGFGRSMDPPAIGSTRAVGGNNTTKPPVHSLGPKQDSRKFSNFV